MHSSHLPLRRLTGSDDLGSLLVSGARGGRDCKSFGALAEGLQLTGEGGPRQLTRRLRESALEGEISDHSGL